MDDFSALDAVSQAELVRRGEVAAVELVQAAIERIERLNPRINAVVATMYDQALRDAAKVALDAPLAGVPFLLKDLTTECAGIPLTAGSAFLSGFVPEEDCELVKRYKRAGLIILGKTNTSEFGARPTAEPRLFGPTRNPWDISLSSGGSSGGSAAAVASGMVPAAHANDGGGSIRTPASWCGVFGLNPTRGRTPWGPHYGDFVGGLAREHAITRSVRDSAALLDASAGPDLGDPYWAPPPQRPFLSEIGADPGRLKIAFTTLPGHADCVRAVQDAAALCAEIGHQLEEAPPPPDIPWMTEKFQLLMEVECAWQIEDWSRRTGQRPTEDRFEPFTWARCQRGRRHSAADYLLAWQDLQRLARRTAQFFTRYDIWLTPTVTKPPVPLGSFRFPKDDASGPAAFAPFLVLSSVTGQPSASIPLFRNEQGLPIGTHFIARFGDEATLLRLASQLESARPWNTLAAKRTT